MRKKERSKKEIAPGSPVVKGTTAGNTVPESGDSAGYRASLRNFFNDGGLFVLLSEDKPFYNAVWGPLCDELEIAEDRMRFADSREQAHREVRESVELGERPFLFMDRAVEGVSTLPFLETLKTEFPDVHVIVISPETERKALKPYLAAGADNYIIRPAPFEVVIEKAAFVIEPHDEFEERILAARKLLKDGAFGLACDGARDALKLKPGSPAALMIMGDALKSQGKREDALECFEAAARNAPSYLAPLKKLVQFHREEGAGNKVLAYLMKLDELSPLLFERKREIGETLLTRREYVKAGEYLAGAVGLAGSQRMGDAARMAEKYADSVVEHSPQYAVFMYKDCIRFRRRAGLPLNSSYYLRLGFALRRLGQWKEAVSAYMEGVRYNRDDAGLFYNTGMAYYEGGRFDSAAQVMEKVTSMAPRYHEQDIQAAFNMGLIFRKTGSSDMARRMFEAVRERDPEFRNVSEMLER